MTATVAESRSVRGKSNKPDASKKITRGQVYFIKKGGASTGAEMYSGRPAVVVSNDTMNATSGVVSVVYLRRDISTSGPIHVDLGQLIDQSTSVAACEQVFPVDRSRVGDLLTQVSPEQMKSIDEALRYSLALHA